MLHSLAIVGYCVFLVLYAAYRIESKITQARRLEQQEKREAHYQRYYDPDIDRAGVTFLTDTVVTAKVLEEVNDMFV